MNWLKDNLKLFSNFAELELFVSKNLKNYEHGRPDPCYLVPAFSGLLCPWWQESARAMLTGLTADITAVDVVYAGLRSLAYQTYDILCLSNLAISETSLPADELQHMEEIIVDGGMSENNTLLQSLADILGMF